MHSIESRLVIGPSTTLFAGVYVSTFQLKILEAGAVKGLIQLQYNKSEFKKSTGVGAAE